MISNLASSISWGLAGRFLGRFLAVLSGIVIARILPPYAFGLYAIALAFIRLSEVIIPLGFEIGIIKYGIAYLNEKSKFKGVITFSILISFIFSLTLSLLVFIFSDYLSKEIFNKISLKEVLLYVAIILPFLSLLCVIAPATRISQDPKYSALTQDFGQPFLSLFFFLLFSFLNWGMIGALVAELLSITFSAILALFFLQKLFPFVFNKDQNLLIPSKEYYQFSFSSSSSVIFITAILWVDRLLLGMYWQSEIVGIYQAVAQLSVIFAVIISGINRIITPAFADLYSKEQMNNLHKIYQVGNKWGIYLGIPILIGLFVRADEIIENIYGEFYLIGLPILYILLVGQFINLCTGSVAVLLNITGYQSRLMVISGITFILSVLLNFLLIPIYGGTGAAIATSFSLTIYYLYLLIFAGVKLRMWPINISFVKVIPAAFLCLLSFFVFQYLDFGVLPLYCLLIELFVSSFVFWISLYLFSQINIFVDK